MKVFISWSGQRSKQLGEALRDWLPAVIQAVKPYFTPEDIDKGSRWEGEIARELSDSHFGLLCLTPENLNAPWLLFEAGALSKNLDKSKVCPLLYSLEPADVAFPLAQFQAAKFEKGEILRIVRIMNKGLRACLQTTDGPPNVWSACEYWRCRSWLRWRPSCVHSPCSSAGCG